MRRLLLIPCKALAEAKSRLSPQLTPGQREALARTLLRHTLKVTGSFAGLEPLVISDDEQVLALARAAGAGTIRETRATQGLNAALQAAMAQFQQREDLAFVYLPIDLPLLARDDLEPLLEPGGSVLIAPDAARRGTNLLRWPADAAITPAFGEGSFTLHCEQAARLGLEVRVLESSVLSNDLDTVDDLMHACGEPRAASAQEAAERLIERLD